MQLAGYAHEVLGNKSNRRFVPGFTLCGMMMRIWLFDRAGGIGSCEFDINKEPVQIITMFTTFNQPTAGVRPTIIVKEIPTTFST